MFILTSIATGMGVGSMLGTAIATLTHTSVAAATAVGSLAGAGVGLVTAVRESWDEIEYIFL